MEHSLTSVEVLVLLLVLGAPVNVTGRFLQWAVLLKKRRIWRVSSRCFVACLVGSYIAALVIALLVWPMLPAVAWWLGQPFQPALVAEFVVVPLGLFLAKIAVTKIK